MTVKEAAERLGFAPLTGGEALERRIESVYCCDLLSFVMGRAPADCAWVTVMGNVNAVAVALLADTACIVLAEGAALDDPARCKAEENGIAVLCAQSPVFETALSLHKLLEAEGGAA